MSNELFSKYDSQDLNRIAAKGILEKLRTIRQRINQEFTSRRLIWELIQNAKDNVAICNSSGDQTLSIEISLSESQFTFSHNKGFFTNENIRGLIRRYSSSEKDRDIDESETPPPTTGRFGTGFMTTHLLAENVIVKGVFQIENSQYKYFQLPLDRTGQNEPQIIQGIENAFEAVAQSIKESSPLSKSIDEFKTEFEYQLIQEGFDLAKIGLEELKDTVGYTLINLPNIKDIFCKTSSENYHYSLTLKETITADDLEIQIAELNIAGKKKETKHFAIMQKGETKIIIPFSEINNEYFIETPAKETPRLFLDFPLIGTEDLNIPFIISSPFFEPTEPRDGISLTGGADKDTKINSSIILEGFSLYHSFLTYVADKTNWKNPLRLAKISKPKERTWINNTWYDENILQPTRTKLLAIPIVDTLNGKRISILNDEKKPNIWFPSSRDETVRERIWNLASNWIPNKLPAKEHVHLWYDIIWKDCSELKLEVITNSIQGMTNLEGIKSSIVESITPLAWLNDYYDILNLEEKFIDEIIKDKYAVIPNQKDELKKRKDLFIDKKIDEQLKNVLEILNVDIRSYLKHSEIKTASKYKEEKEGQISYTAKEQETVISEIDKLLSDGKNPNINLVCNYLVSCFHTEQNEIRETIYKFSLKAFPTEIGEKKSISSNDTAIWQTVDKIQLKRIAALITQQATLVQLQQSFLFPDRDQTVKWLDSFITFLDKSGFENIISSKSICILPDQNGVLKQKDVLFIDSIEKEAEDLKDIAALLGYDIREELLEKDIFPVLPEIQKRTLEHLAVEIDKRITSRFTERPRTDITRKVFSSLLVWFKKEPSLAKDNFKDLSKNKHLLYDDDEIADNIAKANLLDDIIAETGLSAEQIKEKLKVLLSNPNIGNVIHQFESLIKINGGNNPDFPPMDTASEPAPINEEMKELIKVKLIELNYQVPNSLGKYSIIPNIIHPNGNTISIVAKSAIGGFLFFNPLEWITLSEPNNQLFIVVAGNKVINVPFSSLEKSNGKFHMRFDTERFSVGTNLRTFAQFFQYHKETKFIFNAPIATSDYLAEFGLDKRNLTATDLSADDKNLLH